MSLERDIIRAWAVRLRLGLGLGLGKSGKRKDGLRGVENSVGTRFGPLEPAPAHSEFCLRQYWTARCAGIVASMAPAERGPTDVTIQNQKMGSEVEKIGVRGRKNWGQRSKKLGSEVEKDGVRGRKRRGQRSKKLGSEVEKFWTPVPGVRTGRSILDGWARRPYRKQIGVRGGVVRMRVFMQKGVRLSRFQSESYAGGHSC